MKRMRAVLRRPLSHPIPFWHSGTHTRPSARSHTLGRNVFRYSNAFCLPPSYVLRSPSPFTVAMKTKCRSLPLSLPHLRSRRAHLPSECGEFRRECLLHRMRSKSSENNRINGKVEVHSLDIGSRGCRLTPTRQTCMTAAKWSGTSYGLSKWPHNEINVAFINRAVMAMGLKRLSLSLSCTR